jgi:hypothetical protein
MESDRGEGDRSDAGQCIDSNLFRKGKIAARLAGHSQGEANTYQPDGRSDRPVGCRLAGKLKSAVLRRRSGHHLGNQARQIEACTWLARLTSGWLLGFRGPRASGPPASRHPTGRLPAPFLGDVLLRSSLYRFRRPSYCFKRSLTEHCKRVPCSPTRALASSQYAGT